MTILSKPAVKRLMIVGPTLIAAGSLIGLVRAGVPFEGYLIIAGVGAVVVAAWHGFWRAEGGR